MSWAPWKRKLHGTEARARRHWRDGERPCSACRNAANQAQALRAARRKKTQPGIDAVNSPRSGRAEV